MNIKNGDRFPPVTASVLDGGSLTLPDDLEGPGILLFYRGHW